MVQTEFPLLEGLGLYASDIVGDGNCLFNSFSDQLYGHQKEAATIRQKTVQYMRDNANYFKVFLDVQGTRPQKKKAQNVGGQPTEASIDRAFETHVSRMEKSGVYGDNMEIVAFARAYNVDVKVYQQEFAMQFSGNDEGDEPRQLIHIAYHSWEHYSSIRNTEGPHSGLPEVNPKPNQTTSVGNAKVKVAKPQSSIQPWMEKVVMSSLPYVPDIQLVRSTLEQCKGNVNEAVSRLLDHDIIEDKSSMSLEANEEDNTLLVNTKPEAEIPSSGKHDASSEFNRTEDGQERSVDHKSRDKRQNHVAKAQQKDSGASSKTHKGVKDSKSEHTEDAKDLGKPVNKQKRETARDKKERQKREAMAKKKDKNSKTTSDDVEKKSSTTGLDDQVEQGMRVLHL